MKHTIGVLLFVSFLLVFVRPALAYIDPGTGSMVVQAVLAAIAACAVGMGVFRRRFKDFWGRLFGRDRKKDE